LFTGEQITGLDGKKRYIKPVRFTLYRELVALLKKYLGEVFIYFCMEDQELWKKILRKDPQNNLDVDWYFANHLSQKFPELNLPKPQKNVYETPVRFLKTGSSL
jgi:spore photoproduct lyase